RFPIDVVKLDASIVRDSERDAGQGLILDSVTALGEGLGLQVVVEGVETTAQLGRLRAAPGRPLAQGYALAPPLPPEALTELLVRGVGDQAGATGVPAVADRPDSAVA
ncbi:EAL domain-containing protein, partial [Acidimicrobiaceae bacterium USS-CC1]|nr:EAL domain-containing protein [Acidiferrimicrobium australe]